MTTIYGCPLSQHWCDTLRNPPCSMAMNAEHRLIFAALHLKRCRLHTSWTKTPKQNNILSQRPIVLFHLYPEQQTAWPSLKVKHINKRISNWCIWYNNKYYWSVHWWKSFTVLTGASVKSRKNLFKCLLSERLTFHIMYTELFGGVLNNCFHMYM